MGKSNENISWQQANIDKIHSLVDWKPKYTIIESIDYLLNNGKKFAK